MRAAVMAGAKKKTKFIGLPAPQKSYASISFLTKHTKHTDRDSRTCYFRWIGALIFIPRNRDVLEQVPSGTRLCINGNRLGESATNSLLGDISGRVRCQPYTS